MMNVEEWCNLHSFSSIEVDCATTVMLKIIDGKCKMKPLEKIVMEALYDQVKQFPGQFFNAEMHEFIERVRDSKDEATKMDVYEQRVIAETMISRPVMKQFKARIRTEGLLECEVEKQVG